MINSERIVPVQKTDLLSLIGTVLGLIGTSYAVIESADVAGDFTVTGSGDAGNKLANQPVKTCDFAEGVTAGVVYFIPAYDYAGFKLAGVAVETEGVEVDADGVTLYKATLSTSTVTIAKVTP